MERPNVTPATGRREDAPVDRYGDPGPLVGADEDRWVWRARIKRNPVARRAYRLAVGVLGAAIVVLGLVLLPAPGPGWLIIFAGLAVLASEFEWAQRLLDFARRRVHLWTEWTKRQNVVVRALVVLAIIAVVLAVFWLLFLVSGVPGFFPDVVEQRLQLHVPGL